MKIRWTMALLALLASSTALAYQDGDWVLARWKSGEYWFPGVVKNQSGSQLTIAYDDGTREKLSRDKVRPYNWKVGSRVECRWQNGDDWYAGKITKIARDGVAISIAYDDGDREDTSTGACRSK
ncbi:MAG: hypothetical protein GX665_07290 [Gammaproteobacteria bacterium]|nr:hypothetical protein [Gammaproteobacteria bacterium]